MMRTLLIDADILAYKVASRNQEAYDFGDTGVGVYVGDPAVAKVEAVNKINKLLLDLKAHNVIVCFSCPTDEGFRRDILPSYKRNRTQPKPIQLQEVRYFLTAEYETRELPRLEADDVLGIYATHPDLVHGERIVVSEDKDLKTIPCKLHNPDWKNNTVYTVSEQEAHYNHMYQTLMGDAVDGYGGCKDIGKVKAAKILNGANALDYWDVVVETYISKGYTEEDALVQARCARILQYQDYSVSQKKLQLWHPSNTLGRFNKYVQ